MSSSVMKRVYVSLILIFLLGCSCIYAKRDVTVYVPVVDALTGNPFRTDMYNPVFHVCSAEDSTVITKSKGLVGNECAGFFHSDNDNGKFLIHVFVDGVANDGVFFRMTHMRIHG